MRPIKPASFVASAMCLATLTGCGKGCKGDHPYVPYVVGDGSTTSSSVDESPAPTVEGGDAGLGEPVLIAPPGATSWKVEGLDLKAPEGRELVLAIVRDVDGDGRKDALAIVKPPTPALQPARESANRVGEQGEIVFYPGAASARPRTLATAPPARDGAGCGSVLRLSPIGARSAIAEIGSICNRGASSRAFYVVRLSARPAIAFDFTLVDPPNAPKLTVDVEGADRDRDGIDDVTLQVAIEGGGPPFEPGPKLVAKLAFFDRPAGPSRDPDEPEASLRAVATLAASRAAKPKEAPSVPLLVQQLRALYRATCAEGGAPRLVKPGGTTGAISCGTSKPLEDAGVAEVRSFVARGDALRAIAAADVAQLAPATKTAARTAEIASLLGHVAPVTTPRATKILAVAVPSARPAQPEWGPLAFEPSGKLLVRTGGRVVRADPDSGETENVDVPAWSAQVLSPDGQRRWIEAYHACEGVSLRATFAPTGTDGDVRDVPLPIAPPLGTRCGGGRGEPAATTPIAWGPRGLEVLVAGQPLLLRPEAGAGGATLLASPLDEVPPPGSARSPGGRAMAVGTSQGVLVRTTARVVRVRAPELEPYADLGQCTTTDDGLRVACAKRGRVVVATLEAP